MFFLAFALLEIVQLGLELSTRRSNSNFAYEVLFVHYYFEKIL